MWVVNWKTMGFVLGPFVIIGMIMVIVGLNTNPQARTDDGYSQKWFLILFGSFFILLAPATIAIVRLFMRRQAKRIAYFNAQGLRGVAQLLSCEMTGTEINNVPQYEMILEITVQGKEPYSMKHKECLTPLIAGKICQGMEIPVLVDPKDPKKIMLEW